MRKEVHIVAAVRTAIGNFGGAPEAAGHVSIHSGFAAQPGRRPPCALPRGTSRGSR